MLKSFSKLNKGILYTTFLLVVVGIFIFFSASLSNLKNMDFFFSIFFKQIVAVVAGIFGMLYIASSKKITGLWLRIYSGHIFIAAVILQLLVLIPGVGLEIKGAKRWADIGFISIQPSEIFKYAFVIFFIAVVVTMGVKLKKLKTFLKFSSLIFIPLAGFFYYIHDFGTLMGIVVASIVALLISQAKNRYIIVPSVVIIAMVLPILYFFVPYVHDRLEVYINPENADLQKDYYQLDQMFKTIGSGQITGRGFGASLQKFSGLLPEPLGDSIFAVYAEEFGFAGSVFLVILFNLLLFFILYSARKLKNNFEKMVVVGLGVLIVFPAFYNIGAAVGVVPLSGMPITFVSKGGTAIFAALLAVGVILNITKKKR